MNNQNKRRNSKRKTNSSRSYSDKNSKGYEKKDNQTSSSNEVKHGIDDKSRYNDASWYSRNSQLALDAGRLAFTWPTGAPIDMQVPYGGTFNAETKPRFPGVMALTFMPTYGIMGAADDPVNVSAKNIYSWVRHANSGHSNYDAPDLMLYILAVDNIYMAYQHMCRIYGLLRMFAQKNRHMPETILRALCVDYDDFLQNMADFRAYINTTAVKIGSLCVPNTMPLFQRHAWMNSGVYADSPSIKSQFYVFKPLFFAQYNEVSGAGELIATSVVGTDNTLLTFSALKTIMDGMIARVIESEDMNIMSGDILKAYGESGLMKVAMIGEDYMIAPQFNIEVLRQIQNATILNGAGLVSGQFIYQDVLNNVLKSGYVFDVPAAIYGGKRIMTGSSENPDPAEVLVNSRLMITGTVEPKSNPSGDDRYTFTPSSIGTEAIVWAKIYNRDSNNVFVNKPIAHAYVIGTNSSVGGSSTQGIMQGISVASYFNYHPFIALGTAATQSTAGTAENYNVFFDVDNYAIVDAHDVDKLHNTAILSLFDVPQIGRV